MHTNQSLGSYNTGHTFRLRVHRTNAICTGKTIQMIAFHDMAVIYRFICIDVFCSDDDL